MSGANPPIKDWRNEFASCVTGKIFDINCISVGNNFMGYITPPHNELIVIKPLDKNPPFLISKTKAAAAIQKPVTDKIVKKIRGSASKRLVKLKLEEEIETSISM